MTKTIFSFFVLLLVSACVQQPPAGAPVGVPTSSERFLGTLEVAFSLEPQTETLEASLVAQNLLPSPAVGLRIPFAGNFDDNANGFRYLWATVEVANQTDAPLENISFHAYHEAGAGVGGSAIKGLVNASNQPLNDPALANSILPLHKMIVVNGQLRVSSEEADFQGFTPEEAAALEALIRESVPGFSPASQVLEYGFVVRNLAGGRTLAPGEQGVMNIAVRLPLGMPDALTPFRFSLTFALAQDSNTRVTRAFNEPTAQAQARAAALGAELLLIGNDAENPPGSRRLENIRISTEALLLGAKLLTFPASLDLRGGAQNLLLISGGTEAVNLTVVPEAGLQASVGTLSLEPGQRQEVQITQTAALCTASSVGLQVANAPDVTVPVRTDGRGLTPIFAIQGNGSPPSPLAGQTIVTEGVVTADFRMPGGLNGFFVQDRFGDGNPATSDGIFVFTPAASTFSGFALTPGDAVQVSATVGDFGGTNQLTFVTDITRCDSGVFIAPTPIGFPVAEPSDLNSTIGMLVTIPQTMTITELFNLGRFGEFGISSDGRLFHPNNGNDNNTFELAARRRILIDDGSSVQNPNPIPYLYGHADGSALRMGDSTTGITGILTLAFGEHRIHPTQAPTFERTNPRPLAPADVGGSLTVTAYNVLNYFTTFGDRGAANAAEFERQQIKLVAAIQTMDADVVGLIEMENNGSGPGSAVQNLVDALNAAYGFEVYAVLRDDGLDVGTDAIKQAIIYKPASVEPLLITTDSDPVHNRPPVAGTFRSLGPDGGTFTLVVVHHKSKRCSGGPGSTDPGNVDSSAGCFNLLRTQQSQALLNFATSLGEMLGDSDFLLMGDFNANNEESPVTVLLETGIVNRNLDTPDAARYSFVFQGFASTLDYAFATPSMNPQVTGSTIWHINSDEARALEYSNSRFSAFDTFEPTPFRSSDHDPKIVGLNLTPDGTSVPQDFGLSVSPTLLEVTQGESANASVSIIPTGGFSGNVTLSATPVAGVTLSFNPVTITTGVSSTLTVTVAGDVAPADYPITITGDDGTRVRTVDLTLRVRSTEVGACVVISQAYGGGGNSGAFYRHDFIELFNRCNTAQSLAGWSVQYASATGTTWSGKTDLTFFTLQPGQYYLIQQAAGSNTNAAALPTPDLIANPAIAMAAGAGKVALVSDTTVLTCGANCANNPAITTIVDYVGYGNANDSEGSGPAPALGNDISAIRLGGGCTDTDQNNADFTTATPPTPRNSSTVNACTP